MLPSQKTGVAMMNLQSVVVGALLQSAHELGLGLAHLFRAAGYKGTATAGDEGTATAGNWGTATAGYKGTATAGYKGTATAGDGRCCTAPWPSPGSGSSSARN